MSRRSAMTPKKIYLDKAVQTSSSPSLESSHMNKGIDADPQSDHSYDQSVSEHLMHSADLSSAIGYLGGFDAYMRSDTTKKRLDIANSPNRFRRVQRYAQIQYNQPSQVDPYSRRIVSLPETSPPYRIYQVQGNGLRVVSMPEHLKHTDAADKSSEGSFIERSQQLSNSLTSEDKSDVYDNGFELPRTPSPPSSDSIMIIENNQQVSKAFLVRKSSPTLDSIENEGWIPLQLSPPRPIPALHGPLSLPYARCPSGAEGTIIEGEDLSHVVWGLNSNTSHSANPKSLPLSPSGSRNDFRKMMPSVSQDSFVRSRGGFGGDVIDLSRPGTLYIPSTSRAAGRHPSHSTENPILVQRAEIKDAKVEYDRRNVPVHLYSSSLGLGKSDELRWTTGLGINIPSSLQGTDALRSFEPSLPFSCYGESQPQRRLPGEPGAYNIHLQRLGNRIAIQTPTTSASQWTPQFCPTYATPLTPDVKDIPHITVTDLEQDFVGVGRLGYPRFTTPELPIRRPERSSSSFTPLGSASCLPFSTNNVFRSGGCADLRATKGLSKQTSSALGNPLVLAPSASTNNTKQNLSYPQPRSIPLTRLVQRKLTSVAEEVEPRDIPSAISVAELPPLRRHTGRPSTWVPSPAESKKLNPPGVQRDARNGSDTRAQSNQGAENELGRNKENDPVRNTATKPNKFYRKKHVKVSHNL